MPERHDMLYSNHNRIRDPDEGVLHIHEPGGQKLSVCEAGFAASTMELGDFGPPTCLFCLAGMRAGLTHWRLRGQGDRLREYIESHPHER